jgi:hypothetical protein
MVAARDGALLLGLAAAVVAALWAGPNLAVAEPAAAVAVALGAAWMALEILPRLRRLTPPVDPTRFDRVDSLGEIFEEGAMGRQTIIATINGLESEVFGVRRLPLSLDDEIRLSRAPAKEFRAWVDARLTELELAT